MILKKISENQCYQCYQCSIFSFLFAFLRVLRGSSIRHLRAIFTGLGILLLLLGWMLVAFWVDSFIVPQPWTSLYDTLRLLSKPHTWLQISISLTRVIAGFSLAFVAGTAVGMLIGSRQEFEILCKPAILIVQGIPPILWAIPLILILGSSHLSPILVIALICFPLVTMTVGEGMKSVPQKLKEMLKVFAPGAYPTIKEVILPHLKPFFAASLKLGFVLGVKASVIAEYFGANNGIGFQIQVAYQSLQVRKLFAWGMLFVVLIIIFDTVLSRLEKWSRTRQMSKTAKVSLDDRPEEIETLKNLFLMKRDCPQIKVEHVSFGYARNTPILEEITFSIGSDEIAVISGDSGTGKTTLLNIIASLVKPTAGRVAGAENLGFIFQDDRFLPWRNNAWNVALPLIYQGYSAHNALSFASYLLQEVGLEGVETAYPEELSGGMKKRLAFARCFARLPGSILMDEPFTGLHKEARDALWEKFFALLHLHPVPVVIVTHFPEEIAVTEQCRFYTLSGHPARLVRK